MRTVVHLSDLHFGRIDPALIDPCIAAVHRARPDVVVISGDLTQRARSSQFRDARSFLDRLPQPQIVIPGNHDVPLHNPFARFCRPFSKYRRYISDDLEPFHTDEQIAVGSINTARSFTVAGGNIRVRQIERVGRWLCALPQQTVKIVVTHHPFEIPAGLRHKYLVRHAANAMSELARCGADIFLAGHLHVFHSELSARRYHIPGYSAILVQAGTGLSTRTRGECNAFNILQVSPDQITVESFSWSSKQSGFAKNRSDRFSRSASGWSRLAA